MESKISLGVTVSVETGSGCQSFVVDTLACVTSYKMSYVCSLRDVLALEGVMRLAARSLVSLNVLRHFRINHRGRETLIV